MIDIKVSYVVERLLGKGRGRLARLWSLSQGSAGRQVERNRAEVIKGRRTVCAPVGHTSLSSFLQGNDRMDVDR